MAILDKLDSYYKGRKSSEVWLMVILISVLIGYLLYTVLVPYAENYRKNQENINRDLTTKIESAQSFIRSITVNGDRDYLVKKFNRTIIKKRVELNNYRAKLNKINGAMHKLSSVLYNKDNWSKYLHNIALKANDNRVKIYEMTNQSLEHNSTFGKVLNLYIKCEGKYSNLLSFMNDLEKTKLVSNISSVKLSATPNEPIADINISVWGIKP